MKYGCTEIVKMYPNGFLVYKIQEEKSARSESQKDTEKNLSRGDYNGYMSRKTSKRVRNYINNLHDAQKYKQYDKLGKYKAGKTRLTFVTLTLPSQQTHTDKYIKRHLLNRFITTLQDKGLIDAYLWRAEPQANNNIHFHILTPNYIHWSIIRELWNKILDDHGYIDAYRKSMQSFHSQGFKVRRDLLKSWTFEKQKKAYIEGVKCDWSNPNSVDIHNVKKVKNIGSYIAKYMCKHGENAYRKINGRIWGCSDNLRSTEVCKFTNHLSFDLFVQRCEMDDNIKKYKEEYYTSYYFKEEGLQNYPYHARQIFQNNCYENFTKIFNN